MATSNPSKELWAAQCASPGDEAFDRAHPDFDRRVTEYLRTRSLDDLALVPLRAGLKLTLWRLRPLRPTERTDLRSMTSAALQQLCACRLAVTARIDGAELRDGKVVGAVVEARMVPGGAVPMAESEWIEAQTELAGGQWIDEFGDLVLQRATVHPKAPAPYGLPWPLAVARASGG
jgi:hypothetical protein